ncbi:MAG TPA: DNA/RNA non-specific endonuclease [Bdellovibrio sp.]|nr:DNA/RNA non-specific endonuclease [Bdellovibrio sp.]
MNRKEKSLFSLIVLLAFSLSFGTANAKVEKVLGSVAINNNPNIAFQTETDQSEIIISRDQYVISYNKNRRTPNWVAWKLESSDMGTFKRSNAFAQDSELENYLSHSGNGHAVNPDEYKNSCFDRGHQIPSADRTQSKANNEATFVMSNMIPQTPYLNRVIWEHLESYTRNLVHQGKKVYIIAGPIFDENFGAIGPHNDIQVPSKDFKIIVVLNADQSPQDINSSTQIISVVMPNVQEDGSPIAVDENNCQPFKLSAAQNTNDWQSYRTDVSEIEKLSGLHFSF